MLGSILAIFFLPPQKAYWICPPVQAVDHCRFPSGFAYQTKAAGLPFVMRTHRSGQGHLSDCTSSTWGKEKKKKISPLKQLMAAFPHANAKKLALCLRVAGSKFLWRPSLRTEGSRGTSQATKPPAAITANALPGIY